MANNALKELFAEAYVRVGPLRGDWDAAAKSVGMRKPPSKQDPWLRARIAELGGAVVDEAYSGPPAIALPSPEVAAAMGALESPDDPDEAKWKALWATYSQIASGTLVCEPQQRLALKDLLDRHYGKPGKETGAGGAKPKTPESSVVILPALGSGAGTVICPVCHTRLQGS